MQGARPIALKPISFRLGATGMQPDGARPLSAAYELIHGEALRALTARARELRAAYPPKCEHDNNCADDDNCAAHILWNDAKAAYDGVKGMLPSVIPSGEWGYRMADAKPAGEGGNWQSASGYLFYDFDNLIEAGASSAVLLARLRPVIRAVALAYRTPSGLRLICEASPPPRTIAEHRAAWDAGAALIRPHLPDGVELDRIAGPNPAHFTYLWADRNAYLADSVVPIEWDLPQAQPQAPATPSEPAPAPSGGDKGRDRDRDTNKKLTSGDYGEALLYCRYNVPQDYADYLPIVLGAMREGVDDATIKSWASTGGKYKEGEIERIRGSLRDYAGTPATGGTIVHYARLHGWQTPGERRAAEYRARRQASGGRGDFAHGLGQPRSGAGTAGSLDAEMPPHLREYPEINSDLARLQTYKPNRLKYYAPAKSVALGADNGFWFTLRGFNAPRSVITELRATVMDAREKAFKDYRDRNPDGDHEGFERRVRACDNGDHWRKLADLISLLRDELDDFGMPHDQMASRLLPLPRGQGAWLARAGKIVKGEELLKYKVLDPDSEMPFEPDLSLLDKHQDVVAALEKRYGGLCLDLCALSALGATDQIFVVIGAPGYGKTLLIDLWEEGFGEGLGSRENHRVVSSDNERFSPLRYALVSAAAVFVDEIDKPDKIGAGFIMASTNRRQEIEPKGRDAFKRLRSAQQWWVGNRKPGGIELNPDDGMYRRFPFLIDYHEYAAREGVGNISIDEYSWLFGHARVFAALVLARARELAKSGESVFAIQRRLESHPDNRIEDWRLATSSGSPASAAAVILAAADLDEWILSSDIDEAIAEAGYEALPSSGKRRAAALTSVNPRAYSGDKKIGQGEHKGKVRRVWYGLTLREPEPEPDPDPDVDIYDEPPPAPIPERERELVDAGDSGAICAQCGAPGATLEGSEGRRYCEDTAACAARYLGESEGSEPDEGG